jgi:membrane-bound lytic murein transglycosylase MltF
MMLSGSFEVFNCNEILEFTHDIRGVIVDKWFRHGLFSVLLIVLSACGGDAGSNESEAQGAVDADNPPAALSASDLAVGISGTMAKPWTGDLDGMAKRTVLRVATTFSRTNFFLDEGRPQGITYEMVTAFEKDLRQQGGDLANIRMLLIPMSRDELLDAVASGRADIAAANLTITADRQEQVQFSRPWASGIRELVVTGPEGPDLQSLDDLAGKSIYVRHSSSYFESLQALTASLRERGLQAPEIVLVDELMETEDILELVAAGVYSATVADSSLTGLWQEMLPGLVVHEDLAINSGREIAWALRKNSPQLAAAVNDFVAENSQGTLMGNILIKRYFENNRWVRNALNEKDTARLDELAGLFQTYAGRYDFDWLLSAAQAYQESGFDQSVVSHAGAVGVMQLLPSTAADPNVGIPDIEPVENNIHAGIKYKKFMLDRYFNDPDISPLDQFLFTLAAYNAGPARINQYRKKAAAQGLDPNRWFRHVEQVSNRETKTYVSNIFKYYLSYREYQRRIAAIKASKAEAEAEHG